MIVSSENLESAIIKSLQEYSDDVADGTHNAVDQVTREVNDIIKSNIKFRQITGKYVKAFRTKTSYKDKRNKRNTWYVQSPHYRLTHLLEYGHRVRGSGSARAYPHIKYGAESAERRLPELIEKVIEGG